MKYSPKTIQQMGRMLKNMRIEQNLTQEQVAQRVGLMQKTVSVLEQGSEKSTLGSLMKLLSALQYDIEFVPRGNDTTDNVEW